MKVRRQQGLVFIHLEASVFSMWECQRYIQLLKRLNYKNFVFYFKTTPILSNFALGPLSFHKLLQK